MQKDKFDKLSIKQMCLVQQVIRVCMQHWLTGQVLKRSIWLHHSQLIYYYLLLYTLLTELSVKSFKS